MTVRQVQSFKVNRRRASRHLLSEVSEFAVDQVIDDDEAALRRVLDDMLQHVLRQEKHMVALSFETSTDVISLRSVHNRVTDNKITPHNRWLQHALCMPVFPKVQLYHIIGCQSVSQQLRDLRMKANNMMGCMCVIMSSSLEI